MSNLSKESITFGKYNRKSLSEVLKDRDYCKWLKKQEWFQKDYEYLYNRIDDYNPREYFIQATSGDITNDNDINEFLITYPYFNLLDPANIQINLSSDEIQCYIYYIRIINDLKVKIISKIDSINPYDIKAPVKWLKVFENETNLDRAVFKKFLYEYDLENITSILEYIKSKGGIEYKGAQSFKIAKERSVKQEKIWEQRLKSKYGEDIAVQFKYKNCFFDFISIQNKIIYECKLGLKDFNKEQYNKYLTTLGEYDIVYLIGKDVIVDIRNKIIVIKRGFMEFQKDLYTLNGEFIDLIDNYEIKILESPDKLMNYI